MSGKASLIVMIGFSMLFLAIANNFHGVSGRMTDNYVDYFGKTTAHNIAVSGANLAANEIFLDPTWTTGYSNLSYQNGKLFVNVNILDSYKNIRQIVSRGVFNKDTSVVRITLAPSKFSKFAYYSISEGGNIWWVNQDTVWGPFHTQDRLRAFRKPSFYGKASSKQAIQYYTSQTLDAPFFHGGYEQGVDLPMPVDGVTSLKAPAQAGGKYFNGNIAGQSTIYMTFNGDYLYYRYNTTSPFDTLYLPTAAPNGLIFVENGTVRMQGTISGAYTVACSGTSGTRGTIYLDDDVKYKNDPRTDPTSIDMLGIVAQKQVLITDNTPNRNDIIIQASIYAQDIGFGADNWSGRPPSGNIHLLGGIIQNTRQAVGQFNSSGVIVNGFAKQYRYDDRFLVASPPFFPGTGGFEIVSWYE